jgi:hypothetical protein
VEEVVKEMVAVVESEAEAHPVLLIEVVALTVLVEEALVETVLVVEPEYVGETVALKESLAVFEATELVGFPERVTAGDAEGDIVAFPE